MKNISACPLKVQIKSGDNNTLFSHFYKRAHILISKTDLNFENRLLTTGKSEFDNLTKSKIC